MTPGNTPQRTSPVLIAVPVALVLGTFAVIVQKLAKPVVNTDTYFHMRMGAEFLHSWTPWEPGSVTRFATADWVPSQWLGQIAYGAFDQWFGLPGVAWLSGAVVLCFALTLYFVTRRSGSLVVTAFVIPVTVLACAPALSGRPQVLSYIFTALVTSAWMRTRMTGRVAWWIVPLTWVWAMVHGMWSVSIVISVVASIGLLMDKQAIRPRRRDLVALPVFSALAAALTPVGPQIYSAVVRVGEINHYFAEWGPTKFTHPSNALAAGTMVILLVAALRTHPMPFSTIALVLLAGAWLLYSNRTVPVGVSMLAPLLSTELTRVVPDRARSPREFPLVVSGFAIALVALALAVPRTSAEHMYAGNAAHGSVAQLPTGTGLLNEWSDGGYDMWAHPHLDIVMHGYGDMFTSEEIKRNADLAGLEPGWVELIQDLGVTHALLRRDGSLAYALTELLGWKILVEDDDLVHLHAPED